MGEIWYWLQCAGALIGVIAIFLYAAFHALVYVGWFVLTGGFVLYMLYVIVRALFGHETG